MAQKLWLTRKETKTLLTTLKATAIAGALSLTLTGWGLLAQTDMKHAHQTEAATNTMAGSTAQISTVPVPAPAQTTSFQTATRLNIVRWTRSVNGNAIAVVQNSQGQLWYVMGSDVPRIEQGLQPQFQPQQVRTVTRTRAS